MKSFVLFVTFLFGITISRGQQIQIRGIVTDPVTQPIQYATVGLFKKKDGKAIVVSYSDEKGKFLITYSQPGEYWLMVSHGNYENYWQPISVAANSIQDTKIQLINTVKELQDVTVRSTRRLITMRDDGISYHADNDPMANADKAIDLLRKMPMVNVEGDGKVTVNGQTSFRVLVNGRETAQFARNASDALKNFPGSIIKRIDVITNPSAKYDAEGVGGIIDIITKRNVTGYNGSLTSWNNYFNPFDWSANVSRGASGTLNLKNGKIGIMLSAVIDGSYNFLTPTSETIQPLTTSFFSKRTSTGTFGNNTFSPEGNLEISYEVDSMNALSIYGSFDRTISDEFNIKLFTLNNNNSTSVEQSNFSDNQDNKSIDWSIGADYIKKFRGNTAKEFTLKFYGVFSDNNLDNVSEQINSMGNNRYVLNDNTANDKQYTIQADWILPLKKERTLEIGAKTILRRATSVYQNYLKTTATAPFTPNLANSDHFTYVQDVYSVYASESFRIGKFNFRTGLRVEHTIVDGKFIASNTTVNQSYTKWLPNLLMSIRLKNGGQMSFSYSQRLNRPYIYSLNPFVNNMDSLNVTTGNPNLDPQLSHIANLQYRKNWKKLFTTVSLGYSYSNSFIINGYFFNKSTGVTTSQPQNGGISERIFVNLSLNANPSQKMRINLNGNVSYTKISSPSLGEQTNRGFSGQAGYNGSYETGSRLVITSFANYYFPVLLLQGTVNAYASYGFGGRYIILKEKLTANVGLNNIFTNNGEVQRVRRFSDQNFASEFITFNRFRGVTLSITWNFGKLREGVSKKRGVSNTDLL